MERWVRPTHELSFGAGKSSAGGLLRPCGLAIDSEHVYVADAGMAERRVYGCVRVYDTAGRYRGQFGQGGRRYDTDLVAPAGVAVDQTGTFYVTDVKLGVLKYDRDGRYLGSLVATGKGEGQVDWPRGIHVGSDGNLWVVDAHNNRVQLFNPQGQLLLTFGVEGRDPGGHGQFERPSDLAVDPEGCVYVTDTLNHRVQKFDPHGRFLAVFAGGHTGEDGLAFPRGIAIDRWGRVYVAERHRCRVQVFDRDGGYLGTFGGGPGSLLALVRMGRRTFKEQRASFLKGQAYGLAIDAQARVYVSDNTGCQVMRFALSAPGPGTAEKPTA